MADAGAPGQRDLCHTFFVFLILACFLYTVPPFVSLQHNPHGSRRPPLPPSRHPHLTVLTCTHRPVRALKEIHAATRQRLPHSIRAGT